MEHFVAEICVLLIWQFVQYSLYHSQSVDIHDLAQATFCLFFDVFRLLSTCVVAIGQFDQCGSLASIVK